MTPVGLCQGTGVYRFRNGDVYQGDWRDNAKEGQGVLRRKDVMQYEGDFLRGDMHGKGLARYSIPSALSMSVLPKLRAFSILIDAGTPMAAPTTASGCVDREAVKVF